MPVKKVDIMLSEIINDLNSGLSWLHRDDLGYGSIENKYGANEMQITMIRKHPKLKDLEPTITLFNIIDDTIEVKKPEPEVIPQLATLRPAAPTPVVSGDDALDQFANL